MNKKTVLILFGGRSVEHEVSIITACQLLSKIDRSKYNPIPVYIDKKGVWWTGGTLEKIDNYKNDGFSDGGEISKCYISSPQTSKDKKRILSIQSGFFKREIDFDIVFPVIHGTYGEDGTLQGFLEIMDVPYVGCDVFASAIGMDKVAQKFLFAKEGIGVVPFLWFGVALWGKKKKKLIQNIEKTLGYPVCIKPANLGSSIGISIARNKRELTKGVEVAKNFDRKIIVERALIDMREINCSVIGIENNLRVSVCEEPIRTENILSYEEKYLKGGKAKGMANLSRLIPAPISDFLKEKIQEISKKAFKVIGGSGISRIDFMYDNKTKKLYLNEINTIPGSLSFYLWEKSGLSYPILINKLIAWGFKRYNLKKNLIRSYNSSIFRKDHLQK